MTPPPGRSEEQPIEEAFVTTLPERCRTCYTCVRECPAKAIRISEGQAEILPSRCIACGNCIRVCSQGAKRIRDTLGEVVKLLKSDVPVAAMLAPSFPAAWPGVDYQVLVGMVRAAGFAYVHEVAFGADLVARRYRELLAANDGKDRYIATSCPAVVAFVERYHPELVPSLAPIVSPMVAMARVLRKIYENNVKIVFIGPCIAKKAEVEDEDLPGELDAANTFSGLQKLFDSRHIMPVKVQPSDFDPPHADLGALFSISRGMLQAADVDEDLMAGDVVSADGREGFVEALREFESGAMDAQLLEILACQGCIMGPGMPETNNGPLFRRRSHVSRYVRDRIKERHAKQWAAQMHRFRDLDLSRTFTAHDQRIPSPPDNQVARILAEMGKTKPEDELNCGACGYDTCREHAVAILKGLAENKMCLPYTIDQLNRTILELGVSNEQLEKTQEALLQSEKLASMGQLAAGIAHELNNPLGVVLMYAHLLLEGDIDEELSGDIDMIAAQADRCKKIVSGLLHFARQNKILLERTDITKLVKSAVKSVIVPKGITVKCSNAMADPMVDVDHDQLLQVLTNLLSNACSAMPKGGTLTVTTEDRGEERFMLRVSDTGTGIGEENLNKIFEPFYTTKGIGKGTGLGLAVAYGIIKMHCGDLSVESNADPDKGPTGSTFTVSLPKRAEQSESLGEGEKEMAS